MNLATGATIVGGIGGLVAGGFAAHAFTKDNHGQVADRVTERTEEFEAWKGELQREFPNGIANVNIERFEEFTVKHPAPSFVNVFTERNGDVRLEIGLNDGEGAGAGQGLGAMLGLMTIGLATMPLGMGGVPKNPFALAGMVGASAAGLAFAAGSLTGMENAPSHDALRGAIEALNAG